MGPIIDNLPYMMGGLKYTLGITVICILGSFILGTALALGRMARYRVVSIPCASIIEVVRSFPPILLIFFVYFMTAYLGYAVNAFAAACGALSVYISGYVAEVVRGGLMSVPGGQSLAARATGLSAWQSMRYVSLPQAVRRMAPALVSQFVILIKDTSLVIMIGIPDFYSRVMQTNDRVLTAPFQLLLFAAAVYFVICFTLSSIARRLELRVDV